MEPAPFHADVADAPTPDRCLWLQAEDGVRLRAGFWMPEGAKGTVLLFPGRTEFVEKYAKSAEAFARRGYAMVAIDWRGQGLSARLLSDRNMGHVREFSDYQKDLRSVLQAMNEIGMPRPRYLVAHSMGGAIGLRSLYEGLEVRAAAFSAPMWGIAMAPAMRPVAWTASYILRKLGLGARYAPGHGPITYVAESPFEGNMLTSDPEMFALMKRQVTTHPELALGGPSMHWLHAALSECRGLMQRPAPDLPILTMRGSNERIVSTEAIARRMASWPQGRLELVPGAEHEIMEERPEMRERFYDAAAALFTAND